MTSTPQKPQPGPVSGSQPPHAPGVQPQVPPEGHDHAEPGPGEPGGPSSPGDPSMRTIAEEQRERSDAGNPIRDERHPDHQRQVPGVAPKKDD